MFGFFVGGAQAVHGAARSVVRFILGIQWFGAIQHRKNPRQRPPRSLGGIHAGGVHRAHPSSYWAGVGRRAGGGCTA